MTGNADLTSLSKFLSYVLRHHPEEIGLTVDENGWASTHELISKAQEHGKLLDRQRLQAVINHGSKQRFVVSRDKRFIRAGYGHSIDVNLKLHPKTPSDILFHGTAKQNVASIFKEGIKAESRNFVHLSVEKADARHVGGRHGKPVILQIDCGAMDKAGYKFYQSESEPGIWLTESVPVDYLKVL